MFSAVIFNSCTRVSSSKRKRTGGKRERKDSTSVAFVAVCSSFPLGFYTGIIFSAGYSNIVSSVLVYARFHSTFDSCNYSLQATYKLSRYYECYRASNIRGFCLINPVQT